MLPVTAVVDEAAGSVEVDQEKDGSMASNVSYWPVLTLLSYCPDFMLMSYCPDFTLVSYWLDFRVTSY